MIKQPFWIFACLFFTFMGVAHALIAPLSPEARQENATQILVGKTLTVEQQDEAKPYGSDIVYTVTLSVDGTEKGEHPSTSTVTFTFWRSKQRTKGWVGNFGQSKIIKPNTLIRAYLIKTPEGKLKLLEPNGWEKI